jgi:BMFP domain-containing protein YqiC
MSTLAQSAEEARNLLKNLRNRLNDLEARFDAVSNWLENTDDRVSELEDENAKLRGRLDALEARIDVVEDGSSTKSGKIRQIVAGAENNRTGGQPAVVMDAAKIVTVTGVSRRYAYDLIDDLPEKHHWILTRSEARGRQFGSVEIDDGKQTKAIVIDFEALHSDPESVNKFTTTRAGEGV